ncbi:hypothetical protein [Legionella nagasakiensis]|uniref:hypothetical protein n=1 Tax=Legionella nagasakiensis TaxID=535290 RepID=UPI0010560BF5|nr:hypothetical protein [Legionella nagasakiensis]
MGDEETNSTQNSTPVAPEDTAPRSPRPAESAPIPIQPRPSTPPLSLSQSPDFLFFSPYDAEEARERAWVRVQMEKQLKKTPDNKLKRPPVPRIIVEPPTPAHEEHGADDGYDGSVFKMEL